MTPWMAESIDRLVAGLCVRTIVSRRRARTDPVALAHYLENWTDRPVDDLLPAPAAPAGVLCRPLASGTTGRRYDVSFRSGLASGFPENDVVRGRLIVGHDEPEPCLCTAGGPFRLGPTLIVLPGWLAATVGEYEMTCAAPVLAAGANTLIVEMPFHTRRAPGGALSGQMAISGDLLMTAQMLRQAVGDVGAALMWLRSLGCERAGVFGVSMGAWIASLLAARTDEPDMLIAAATPARMDDILARSPLMTSIQRDVRASDLPDDHRAAILDLLSPLRFPLRMPVRRVRLIEAAHDALLPGRGDRLLRAHWGGPALVSLPQGHVSLRFSADYREAMGAFVAEQLIGDKPHALSLCNRIVRLPTVVPA